MRYALLALTVTFLAASSLSAEPVNSSAQKDVSAKNVATTPLNDLNLTKDAIPPLLVATQQDPYSMSGLASCRRLSTAIGELDAVLGDDVDVQQAGGKRVRPGQVAKAVVGSFIPFEGVIREISGASGHDRRFQAAVASGSARRSFLKGAARGRGCAYATRVVTTEEQPPERKR
ncbi:MAG: hypothetical protein ABIM50_04835 [Novosphingobium sp.]